MPKALPAIVQFSSVQSLSRQTESMATPWTAACQASLSITNSRSLLKLVSIETVMPSNHLILCHPPLSSPSPPAFNLCQHQGLFKESVLRIRWPKYWSFSFILSLPNEYSEFISFRIDWADLLEVRDFQESSPAPQFKSINSAALSLLYRPETISSQSVLDGELGSKVQTRCHKTLRGEISVGGSSTTETIGD